MFSSLRTLTLCTVSLIALTASAHAQSSAPRPGSNYGGNAPAPAETTTFDSEAFDASNSGRYAQFDRSQSAVEQANDQAAGNYGTLDRSVSMPRGSIQEAWSTPEQGMAPGQIAPGVVHFNWSPDLVMPIRIRETIPANLILPDWERVTTQDILTGEGYNIKAQAVRHNVIALSTTASGIDTTVSIYGSSGNIYVFYVRAEGVNTRKITDLVVQVRAPVSLQTMVAGHPQLASRLPGDMGRGFRAAPVGPLNGGPAGPVNAGYTTAEEPIAEQMIFDLKMEEVNPGDREIAPDLVYTDGVWTYFDYGSRALSAERPVIAKVVDGVETRVNTRTIGRNSQIIVAETLGEFTLRSGLKVICVKKVASPPQPAEQNY